MNNFSRAVWLVSEWYQPSGFIPPRLVVVSPLIFRRVADALPGMPSVETSECQGFAACLHVLPQWCAMRCDRREIVRACWSRGDGFTESARECQAVCVRMCVYKPWRLRSAQSATRSFTVIQLGRCLTDKDKPLLLPTRADTANTKHRQIQKSADLHFISHSSTRSLFFHRTSGKVGYAHS